MGTFTTKPIKSYGRYEVQPGLSVPRRMRAKWEGYDDETYDVEIVLGVRAGKMVCESLTCHSKPGGQPVSSDGIRTVPVASLVFQAVWQEVLAEGTAAFDVLNLQFANDLRKEGPHDGTLRVVALVYRWGHLLGRPPTKDVMEALDIPRATAGRWVSMARRRGFLGAARDRRAGEEVHDAER